jgi:hypothetical protein
MFVPNTEESEMHAMTRRTFLGTGAVALAGGLTHPRWVSAASPSGTLLELGARDSRATFPPRTASEPRDFKRFVRRDPAK